MTSYLPTTTAGVVRRPGRDVAAGTLVEAPAVSGAKAAAIRVVATVAPAAVAAGVVAVGAGAAREADGLVGTLVPAIAGAAGPGGAAPALALGLFAVGALLALSIGARASDRSGRRRAVVAGLVLVALAVAATFIGLLPPAGLLAGIGAAMALMAAPAWLADARTPAPAVAALSVPAVVAGLVAGALVPAPTIVLVAAVVALAAAATPETVAGPQTPVWRLPAKPDFRGRASSVVLLALIAVAVPFAWLPVLPAAIVAGAVLLLIAVATIAATAEAASAATRGRTATAARRAASAGASAPVAAPARPGTRAYRAAVRAFDTTEPLTPALAVTATTSADVAAAVRTAAEAGMGVRMHSTGHAAGSSSDMSGDLLVRLALAGGVTVDEERRLVRIPAGAAWRDVVAATAPLGLAVPHGSSGHVGVVGYLSRGGLSAYARSVGIAANHLESVELVTADGREVTASRDLEPELFWAVRGGGGGFGVITAVTVRAFDPGEVVTGTAMWELADAPAVARAWAEWTATAPAGITTSLRVMNLPPIPGMPFRITRRKLLVVDGTAIDRDGRGASEVAGELLRTLRRAGRPVFDSWRSAGIAEVPFTHMDPDFGGIAHRTDTALLGAPEGRSAERSRAIVEAFLAQVTADGSPFLMAELRQLGGALAEAPDGGGAVAHLDADFAWFTGVMISRKRTVDDAAAAFAGVRAAFGDWVTDYTMPTFASDRDRPQRNYPAEVRTRVEALRERIDPAGLFRGDVAVGAR
ncbi:FAD-binding oxidoreductase [Agromyces sp. MMS24-K17]|uniref:FAD-binding oxidoreductase n=1 Tax=Agromyces sp. MMS24-K17 TaxID=3372850 RepID=UPI003754332B